MGDGPLKSMSRVEAVQTAKREGELSQALRREQQAESTADHARAERVRSQSHVAQTKAALLDGAPAPAEDLLRRADDFVKGQDAAQQAQAAERAADEALRMSSRATQEARLALAQAQSRSRALSDKIRAAQKQARERRETQDD